MEVYDFEKSLLTRLQETSDVLCARGIALPASEVRTEWANYVEMAIEPTGWQAQWRVPRVICEELSIKFPTVVVGTVEQVLFDELKAIFTVESVQEDDVHMPDKQMVSLEELWPLKEQENDALNVDRTADCLDRLRFFYQHVWMPWDNDEDDDGSDWAEKNLYDRIKFYYDVKKRAMSKRLVSHVLALLAEANYVQKKRELLEMEIEEEDGNVNGSESESLVENRRTSKLVELHLRLNVIKNEMKILEDPTLREAFEKVRFGSTADKRTEEEVLIVVQTGTLDQHIGYLNEAKAIVAQSKTVRICDSLQGALDRCIPSNELYLPPGRHVIKFLEYLNSGGSLKAVKAMSFVDACEKGQLDAIEGKTFVSSKDDDSVLLTVDGDYCFENIVLDCGNVRTGVLIKQGNVAFKNCCLMGDAKSSTKQGIVAFGNSTISLENCVLKDFSTGIYANENCQIHLNGSIVMDCINGLDILCGGQASFHSSEIRNCKTYGVLLEVLDLNTSQEAEQTRKCYNNYIEIGRSELKFEGICEFRDNGKANFVISKTGNCKFNNSCFVEQSTPSNKRKNMED
ncbi:protein nessun dorma isoform X2 [Ochlerotatus camptorhynchus]|uniref:protein nessun dorma isoform X2 n=1 Tax=Ochlerotatus camptorhynchus TaxID=644619 RepID=UPI0031D38606